jgi:hypothetical protein
MIVAYELAQLSTTARNLPRAGAALLVYVSCLIRDDALDFANHTKIAMEKHTDLFTFTLGPIPVILTTKTGPGMTRRLARARLRPACEDHCPIQSDSFVPLLSVSSNLSQDR